MLAYPLLHLNVIVCSERLESCSELSDGVLKHGQELVAPLPSEDGCPISIYLEHCR